MKLILIRHGESRVNAREMAEVNNLTTKGKKQSKELAVYLGDNAIEHFYCSDTVRTIETLGELLEGRGTETQVSISRLIGPKMAIETVEDLKRRVSRFLEDLKIEFGDEAVVAVVSHKATLRMMYYLVKGEDRLFENGSATMLDFRS